MAFLYFLRKRNWPALFGYLFFIGMMAVGYYYNLTFIQLGLDDLGGRLVGLEESQVARSMALLAILTSLTGVAVGLLMQRLGWSSRFFIKLRLAFVVILMQTILTAAAPFIHTAGAFLAWIVAASLALGLGVPATFSLTVDLIPVRDRGLAAALITGASFFFAEVFSTTWRIEQFTAQLLPLMTAGLVSLGVLAFGRFPFLKYLSRQHNLPGFRDGRFVHRDASGRPRVGRSLVLLLVIMFGIFFVDSLGFMRLLDEPRFMNAAWQSPQLSVRLFIGVTHIITALIAGALYTALGERHLFLWIFGLFALTHLMYAIDIRSPEIIESGGNSLSSAMIYATAVSLYTVVNFALWADLSTPRTISRNTALGVALSAWTATFLSTALAGQFQAAGMTLEEHINLVDALALLFFLALLAVAYFRSPGPPSPMQEQEGRP